jgi:hypothetical protein
MELLRPFAVCGLLLLLLRPGAPKLTRPLVVCGILLLLPVVPVYSFIFLRSAVLFSSGRASLNSFALSRSAVFFSSGRASLSVHPNLDFKER